MSVFEVANTEANPTAGGVNREVLGDLVFHHAHAAENMKKLTSIVWPATRSLVVSRVQDLCEVARRQPLHAYHANLLQGLASGAVQETLRAGDAVSVAEVAAWLPPAGQAALEGGGELPAESTPALLLPGSAETVQGSSAMPVVVLEASTLLQAGWADAVDVVWATSVSAECAVTRVMQRNALSRQQASERVQLQIQQLRDAAAEIDLTIDSSGSMQETRLAVSRAWLGRLVAMHGRGEVTVEDSR